MVAVPLAAALLTVATPQPILTLQTLAAPAGGTVQISATGLPPGAPITISIDGQGDTSATADSSGAVAETAVDVPLATAPGKHVVSVSAGGVSTQANVTVEPAGAPEVLDEQVPTEGVGELHVAVSLPAGQTPGARYPVVYFLHGLPAGDRSYTGWPVQLVARLGSVASRAIIVTPQAARQDDPDPEYLDWGAGRNWATAIGVELPQWIDAHFPTIRSRDARALIGVSAGGYGAMSVGLAHLATFAAVESWSGYFEPTTPDGHEPLDLGTSAANRRASVYSQLPLLAARFATEPTFLGLYVGRTDPLFLADNLRFHRALRARGIRHTWGIYPAGHTPALWLNEASLWVGLALAHLQAAESP